MPAPVYLFTGPEFGERNDTIERYKAQATSKFGEIEYHLLYATDTSVFDLVSLLQNGSLFSPMRFFVYKNAELIKKKEELAALETWITESAKTGTEDAWLFLVSDENSCDKKLESLIPKENKKIFWEMFENQKEQWITNFFAKNGFKIEYEAVSAILELIENNTEALRTECSRFFVCFEKSHVITEDDVENILAHNREESPFTLFDSLCDVKLSVSDRLESSLEILQKIRCSKDSNAVQLVAGLTWCFRKLKTWHEVNAQGFADDFELKKSGFTSKKMQTQYRNASKLYSAKDTNTILANLSATDINLRSLGTVAESNVLSTLIYSIVVKNGNALEQATYEPL